MKTIIFYTTDANDAVTSAQDLSDSIVLREDAKHKLYFRILFGGAYVISMGCVDVDGKKQFIGNHEIIFIPARRQQDIERLKESKDVVWYKNCMIMAGSGEKATALRDLLIDWLLEKTEKLPE